MQPAEASKRNIISIYLDTVELSPRMRVGRIFSDVTQCRHVKNVLEKKLKA